MVGCWARTLDVEFLIHSAIANRGLVACCVLAAGVFDDGQAGFLL